MFHLPNSKNSLKEFQLIRFCPYQSFSSCSWGQILTSWDHWKEFF
ncbi:hypothetical protein Hanom_Chr01g00075811 [Helianthus anomalus]